MAHAVISGVLEQLRSILQTGQVNLLAGVRKESEKLNDTLVLIQGVLEDAEEKEVKNGAVKAWLEQLTRISYDADDVLDDWKTEILSSQIQLLDDDNAPVSEKLWSCLFSLFSCLKSVVVRHDDSSKMIDINERLDRIVKDKALLDLNERQSRDEPRPVTSSFVDASEIYDWRVKTSRPYPRRTKNRGIGTSGGLNRGSTKEKEKLLSLDLAFSEERQDAAAGGEKRKRIESVLDDLQPHTNLAELRIEDYGGNKFPSWMSSNTALPNLVKLELRNCNQCSELPALGRLQNLEHLELWGLGSVKRIGCEFYGLGSTDGTSSTGGEDSGQSVVVFPKLHTLQIKNMEKCEEWHLPFRRGMEIFPKLCTLTVSLGKLKSLEEVELFGINSDDDNVTPVAVFPVLNKLKLFDMSEWEEQGDEIKLPIRRRDEGFIMPCLCELEINSCPKLKSILPLLISGIGSPDHNDTTNNENDYPNLHSFSIAASSGKCANLTLKPLGDRVLVKIMSAKEKTVEGILLPSTARSKPQGGELVVVGEGKTLGKNMLEITVKVIQVNLVQRSFYVLGILSFAPGLWGQQSSWRAIVFSVVTCGIAFVYVRVFNIPDLVDYFGASFIESDYWQLSLLNLSESEDCAARDASGEPSSQFMTITKQAKRETRPFPNFTQKTGPNLLEALKYWFKVGFLKLAL
ncbi:hypothetical protein IFM89_036280 [Coptis chinensis]|uniref:Rx N-terminal domain-containing protein n=1 Tax=Coptis chinensis TaxID=261450 RepID=A0A835IHW4_9MAGN|nr:hypothetical protein IFM89_036280 [Coptis chinensis]